MSETIVYWRGSAEAREDLLEALAESFIGVHQVRSLEDLLDFLERDTPSAIIVDGSASQREASDRIVELENTEILFSYPIILVSAHARKRVGVLQGRYSQLYPIDVPYRVQHVLRGILLLLESNEEIDPRDLVEALNSPAPDSSSQTVEAETVQSTKAAEAPEMVLSESEGEPVVEGSRAARRKSVDDNSIRNRERLKANPDPASLQNTYGGEVFSIATQGSDFDDAKLIPDRANKEILEKAFRAFEQMDPWAAVHARRVTFVASAMAHSLSFNKTQEENVRLVCLFINWASTDDGTQNTRRYDLFREYNKEAVSEVANAFRASAAMIRERLQEERSAATVELIAKMLEGEPGMTPQQKELVAEAECVLIVELADRSCWGGGHWNPFGVYRVMRNLRTDHSMIATKPVKGAMKRVLGEAVTTHITVGNIFVANDDLETMMPDSNNRTGMRHSSTGTITLGERHIRALTVQIADLLPGMRLAQPLTAMDGRVVLDANVKLDQEIVYQLWQLAAVRALKAEVSIQVEL